MKVYSFGAEHAPVILLLPGTCCHWKGNFGRVIPLLADSYRVLCISYDGFDETEHTEFPTILEETEKIETYIQEHTGTQQPSRRTMIRRPWKMSLSCSSQKICRMQNNCSLRTRLDQAGAHTVFQMRM